MTNQENPSKARVNVSITGDHAENLELLRTLMERRMNKRLSIARVIKELTKEALEAELVVR